VGAGREEREDGCRPEGGARDEDQAQALDSDAGDVERGAGGSARAGDEDGDEDGGEGGDEDVCADLGAGARKMWVEYLCVGPVTMGRGEGRQGVVGHRQRRRGDRGGLKSGEVACFLLRDDLPPSRVRALCLMSSICIGHRYAG
jgi:hypothetical protein